MTVPNTGRWDGALEREFGAASLTALGELNLAESNPSPDLGHARSCRHHSCSLRFRRVGLLPLVLMSRPAAVRRRGVRPSASIELVRCGTWAATTKLI